MRLRQFLHEDLVFHGLEVSDTLGTLRAFSVFFEKGGYVQSAEEAFQALAAREESHTTALSDGVAVPHSVFSPLSDIILLVARSSKPVQFGPPDSDPVDLFFVLLSPPGEESRHIKLLARICRLARHPGFLDELRAAEGGSALHEALLRADSQHV